MPFYLFFGLPIDLRNLSLMGLILMILKRLCATLIARRQAVAAVALWRLAAMIVARRSFAFTNWEPMD